MTEPQHEISLTYGCGCRWTARVYVASDEPHTSIPEMCVPEDCQTCTLDSPCAARQRAGTPYQPVQFDQMLDLSRRQRTWTRLRRPDARRTS
jgi:hypothetical protein